MFLVAAVVGAVVLLVSLLFDDVIDGLLPETEWLSGPAIGAFFVAFGVVGWMLSDGIGAGDVAAAGAGVGAGLVFGYGTYRLAKTLMNAPTDPTPRTATLVGAHGTVVTAVRGGGSGEVVVRLAGQPTKLLATSSADLATGSSVVVVEVLSPTKVVVQAATEFWS